MVLLLVYDVPDDRRRTRLFKKLRGFLTPVQKSVFEGELPSQRWNDLLHTVNDTINAAEDSVRIYSICRACRGSTTLLGTSPPVRDPKDPILV